MLCSKEHLFIAALSYSMEEAMYKNIYTCSSNGSNEGNQFVILKQLRTIIALTMTKKYCLHTPHSVVQIINY